MATRSFCDVVMKGGIASGIVYPDAALALAGKYRFKNIGGTSAGAIAASVTAAAALGERRKELGSSNHGDTVGLDGLRRLAAGVREPGFLAALFQPAPGGRAAFDLIFKLSSGVKPARGLAALAIAILTAAPLVTLGLLLLLLAIGWLIGDWPGFWAALVPAIPCALAAGIVRAATRSAKVIDDNLMGLCPGMRQPGRGGNPPGPALTEQLHALLQSLSGNGNVPLLFEDLWNAPLHAGEPETGKAIALELITTGISHHEPRSIPFQDSHFWFSRDEFDRLFPKDVVDWMVAQDSQPLPLDGGPYYRLPEGGRLPVLVAARMSLSFPILIAAVPLHEADPGEKVWWRQPQPPADKAETSLLTTAEGLATGGGEPSRDPAKLRRCWFSDGGIASNFPIHLFDAPLPRWPTFAIDILYTDIAEPPPPFLVAAADRRSRTHHSSIEGQRPYRKVFSFLFQIIATMQEWRDVLQSRAPGHRERIVHIPLGTGQGGMNLHMDDKALALLAERGNAAGELLARHFDFDAHWWVRWRNAASGIERFSIDFARAAGAEPSPGYALAHRSAWTGRPQLGVYPFTAGQQKEAQQRLATLARLGDLWAKADPDLTRKAPLPLAQLRLTQTF